MVKTTAWITVVLSLLNLTSCGCSGSYRAETVVRPDGSIERSIYQPENDTPEAVQKSPLWTKIRLTQAPDRLEKDGRHLPISSILSRPPYQGNEGSPYFAARGIFHRVLDIPDHVVIRIDNNPGLPEARLVRSYQRRDYVFVVEHRWRETLTDVVTREGMRRARGELADLLISLAQDTFEEAVGKEYDGTALFRWLQREGKTWLAEGTDFVFLESALRKGPAARETMWSGVADICGRHGLVLKTGGKLLTNEEQNKTIDAFLMDLACKHIRRKTDGKPLDRHTAAVWLADLKEVSTSRIFMPVWKKMVAGRFKDEDTFTLRFQELLLQVVGIHYFRIASYPCDYRLVMPGEVVETNGKILDSNRVLWQFGTQDAYPLGYAMECRSLDPQLKCQQNLLPEAALRDREARLDFVSLVTESEGLAEALRQCKKQTAISPLYEYRKKVKTQPSPAGEGQRLEKLMQLLKLPAKP